MTDILQTIRDLQFSDKTRAEELLLSFVRDNTPFEVEKVTLTPHAVSLNSFNGILDVKDGSRYFFKSHTETDTIISEFYNAELLASAGYPVIQPIYRSTEAGKQILIYELIASPSVFDYTWNIEVGLAEADAVDILTRAQQRSDDQLLSLYQKTLHTSTEESNAAPIHQLFYHRLVGGRLDRFYGSGTTINLPDKTHDVSDLRRKHWVINGRDYGVSLNDLIDRAIEVLKPVSGQPTIIGHGDAHNGNVFIVADAETPDLLYFDPAFAGRHHPLLDLVKPLFHNVFAMWMYYPDEKSTTLRINHAIDAETIRVDYDYDLHDIRQMFLSSKVERVLIPLLRSLHEMGILNDNWREYVKLALFCCPLLTMDLTDHERFPPEISLLGLVMSVEMGADSPLEHQHLIDQMLDSAARSSGVSD